MPSEPKVFLPKTPIEFSNQLIGKLDSSVESDYTRSQYTDKHIQDLVNAELKKQQAEASKILKEQLEKASEVSEKKLQNLTDANGLKKKLAELKSKLESRPKVAEWPADLSKSRESLIACLSSNQEKPLKCQEQFEEFKAKAAAWGSK